MKTDVIVIGGGHAGIEAANIITKKNLDVLLITGNIDYIGQMSCNPSIGGISKGNIVREIDALGGVMAKIIDEAGIHFKMLNRSKGSAVWGNRAQADKELYRKTARKYLEKKANICFLQGYVKKVLVVGNTINGVMIDSGQIINSKAVILSMGTFLNGMIHIGLDSFPSGRIGEPPSTELTESLNSIGIKSGRLKTGTSPRIDGRSIDYKKFELQKGDDKPWPFSYSTINQINNKVPCYIGKTNKNTHSIILESLDKSPLYTGKIRSIGPRYCPSIEDKIVRFGEREGHTVFLEPENVEFSEIYINGISTSLPFKVQIEIVHSIQGLEEAKLMRPGYGIEYDFFPPTQLKKTLESKTINNLFFAGQINGTSGYEEAACQGLIAGINAAQKILEKEPLILGRETSYIGVLVDDLVMRGTEEPYRMFTSRAEHRLLLRQDNSDERLMPISHRYGFLEEEDYEKRKKYWEKKKNIKKTLLNTNIIDGNSKKTINAYEILKRPEITFSAIQKETCLESVDDEKMIVSIESDIKYEGFEEKERRTISFMKRMEKEPLPNNIDFNKINGLSTESRNILSKKRPQTIGQASRIAGITPSDILTLTLYIQKYRNNVSRETVGSSI